LDFKIEEDNFSNVEFIEIQVQHTISTHRYDCICNTTDVTVISKEARNNILNAEYIFRKVIVATNIYI